MSIQKDAFFFCQIERNRSTKIKKSNIVIYHKNGQGLCLEININFLYEFKLENNPVGESLK